jgi:hypothetical protein
MNADALLQEIGVDKSKHRDLHVTRMFSAFVVVSEGKVIRVTEPSMSHCPLARYFYPEYADSAAAREKIRTFMDERLSDLREVEKKTGICATGVRAERLREMEAGADLVWACGSPELRAIVGKKARHTAHHGELSDLPERGQAACARRR